MQAEDLTVPDGLVGGVTRFAAPLRQKVVDELRGSIVEGRYSPGSRLIERVLCEEMQVSRTVIREALRQLESEHLITLVPNVGPIVRFLTRDEVLGLYEVRAALESLAGKACAECVEPSIVERLDEALAFIEHRDTTDIHGLLRGKDDFLRILVVGSNNAVIGEVLSSIHARVSQLRARTLQTPGRLEATILELHEIRDAVAAGDGAAAADACRRHVETAGRIALASFDLQ